METNKEFEKWYQLGRQIKIGEFRLKLSEFNKASFAYQWGVYLEFFDSKGIYIHVSQYFLWQGDEPQRTIRIDHLPNNMHNFYKHGIKGIRQQVQEEAIEKAFEILEKLNN